ncbi:MAG TPA: membrane protein insertase YidC [Thermoanaerobaculia bacterium]|nr:membrane protein insertase YidC [Thermoanaerobaculia bacterium]
MERRIFIAIVVSIAVLWIWAALAPRFFPELAKKPAPAPAKTTTHAPAPARPAPSPAASAVVSSAPLVPISASSRIDTVVNRPDFVARFSNRGAELISFKLTKYLDKDKNPVELVKSRPATQTDFPFAIEAENGPLAQRLNKGLWVVNVTQDRNGAEVIEYRFAADGYTATKTFHIGREYQFAFSVAISPAVPYRVISGPGLRTLSPEERDSRIVVTGNGVVQRGGSFDVINREKGDRLRIYENVDFIGIEDNYFLGVLRPQKSGGAVLRRVDMKEAGLTRKELYAGVNAAPDGTIVGSAFLGPKETKLLDRYGLASALQFGMFGIIARFLLEALIWVNTATKNYGFAIIVLTIIIKVVLYPLQHKSIVSMKKMQKVQPKMEAIKARYKKARTDADQRQKMNMEMMKLYQQEGINPMGGCLPILLQLPILWGFYGLLSRAIELRGAPFILWIHDLSDKDPYYVTPLLMTITMFIQTWITPATGDPTQRRMFLIMPVVFGWFFKEMPSGLVLYWLVQNILTIAQQMIMNRWWKEHPAELQQ